MISTQDTWALAVCKSTLFLVLTNVLVDGVPIAPELSDCSVVAGVFGK